MRRDTLWTASVFGALLACGWLAAAARDAMITEPLAAQHGLSRTWFTQIQVDRARGRVAHVILHGGTLFVQTDQGVLHAVDAETGQTLWAEQVGNRNHPSLAPAANENLVAVVNGSNLFILNRFNGKLLWQTQIDGAPGAGPALSSQRAYVPTVNGLVYSYRLKPVQNPLQELGKISQKTPEQESAEVAERRQAFRLQQAYLPPLVCQSTGRSLVQPIVTRQKAGEEYLAWSTDRGYLYVGRINRQEEDRFTVAYRLETNGEIVAPPTYLPPDPNVVGDSGVIYAVSKDGFVHAVRERDGESLWRFPTGEPLVQPASVVDQQVYVPTQPGGMYCLDAKTGKQVWWTPQVVQFVAASKDRVYASDKTGQTLVLDAKNGSRLDTIAATAPLVKLINAETDRIYLVAETGLIQCLHETEQSEPIRHVKPLEQQPTVDATKLAGPASTETEGEKPADEKKTVKPPSGGGGGATGFKPKPKKKKKTDEFGDETGTKKGKGSRVPGTMDSSAPYGKQPRGKGAKGGSPPMGMMPAPMSEEGPGPGGAAPRGKAKNKKAANGFGP
jgi:outer membrane protein assembly factor BamB